MKVAFQELNELLSELKIKGVPEIRISGVEKNIGGHDYPNPIRTLSVFVTSVVSSEIDEEVLAEYQEPVGCYDDSMDEEIKQALKTRMEEKVLVLRELLADEFLLVGTGKFE